MLDIEQTDNTHSRKNEFALQVLEDLIFQHLLTFWEISKLIKRSEYLTTECLLKFRKFTLSN